MTLAEKGSVARTVHVVRSSTAVTTRHPPAASPAPPATATVPVKAAADGTTTTDSPGSLSRIDLQTAGSRLCSRSYAALRSSSFSSPSGRETSSEVTA